MISSSIIQMKGTIQCLSIFPQRHFIVQFPPMCCLDMFCLCYNISNFLCLVQSLVFCTHHGFERKTISILCMYITCGTIDNKATLTLNKYSSDPYMHHTVFCYFEYTVPQATTVIKFFFSAFSFPRDVRFVLQRKSVNVNRMQPRTYSTERLGSGCAAQAST